MFKLDFDNPWIAEADGAKRRAHGWAVSLVAIPVAVLTVGFGGVLAGAAAPVLGPALSRLPPAVADLIFEGLLYLVIFGVLWIAALAGGAFEGRKIWARGSRPAVWLAGGLVLGAGGFAVAAAAAGGLGGLVHGNGLQGARAAAGVLTGVALIAFQAGAEEAFFRGWVQPVLCARWGPWLGLLATSVFFGVLHLLAGAHSALAVVNLLLGGIWFGLLALRSGGLWAPFAAHFAWNWVETCGLGLDPNPGVGPTGAIVDLDLTGPALWSGGPDALNGSLAATVVLTVFVLGLAAAGARSRSAAASIGSAPLAGRRSGRVPS